MRNVLAVTVSRSDYGILLPVLTLLQSEPSINLQLIVTGSHLSPHFGNTVDEIDDTTFQIAERIDMLLSSDTPSGIGKSIGLGVIGFSQAFDRLQPDILLLIGDRFETHAAAVAALPFNLPVAHIHGGERTEGAIDDSIRHSITKLSHLHFVATPEYKNRVMQLGEEVSRVIISGAPSLDNLKSITLLPKSQIGQRLDINMELDPYIITFHPVTLEFEETESQVKQLLHALERTENPLIFTMPNADTSNSIITSLLKDFVSNHCSAHLFSNLGTQIYFSLMSTAEIMVGNSSSGLIEAPMFGLPVVNVGNRQNGRVKGTNIIDVGYPSSEIAEGIKKATSPDFRKAAQRSSNPYGNGGAANIIADHLKNVPLGSGLLKKPFVDIPYLHLIDDLSE